MIVKINCLEYEYGILCNKTRSVDDILDRWVRVGSADIIYKIDISAGRYPVQQA